jgi:hypothetical protein
VPFRFASTAKLRGLSPRCQRSHIVAYALPARGSLIVYERLIDDERRVNAVGLLSSLNMLVMTEGGFGFTAADCLGWMRETGFRDTRVEPLTSDHSMIVGTK